MSPFSSLAAPRRRSFFGIAMRHQLFSVVRIALAGAWVGLAACSSGNQVAKVDPPEVVEFSATPNPVAAGDDVTLTWSVRGDQRGIKILRAEEELVNTTEATGSFVVAKVPAGETKFTLFVEGARSGLARYAEVKVTAVTSATITKFSADKTAVASNGAVVLTWQTVAADSVTLFAGTEQLETFTGALAASGTRLVRPDATTEFVLRATSVGGMDEKKLSVDVLPAPVIQTATASESTVKESAPVTLTWTTTNADKLSIRSASRELYTVPSEAVASGSWTTALTADATFTFVAQGPGGQATKDVSVSVIATPRVASFSALPSDVLLGMDVLLQWQLEGVSQVALVANGQPVTLPVGSDGPISSLTVQPTETTVYRISGSANGETVSADLTVSVYGEPDIVLFEADRNSIFRRREKVTLSWITTSATAISITDSDTNSVDLTGASAEQGSVEVSPLQTTDYILTVVGAGGLRTSAPIHVEVKEPPPFISMTLGPPAINEGGSSDLSWEVADATSFELSARVAGSSDPATPVDISGRAFEDLITVSPVQSTEYTISATGPGGTSTETVTLLVTRVPRFVDVTTPKLIVTRGTNYRVDWTTTDATDVSFLAPFVSEGDTPNYASIEGLEGTHQVIMPNADTGMVEIPFPDGFKFPQFSQEYDSARMAVDGYVCFGGDVNCLNSSGKNESYGSNSLPSTTNPDGMLAAFWDSLTAANGGRFFWRIDGYAPTRRMIFEWKGLDFTTTADQGSDLNFQAVIFETGHWEIWNAPRVKPSKNEGSNYRWGTSASFGFEAPGGASADSFVISSSDSSAKTLCKTYKAGSTTGPTFGTCDPITRQRPKLYAPNGAATFTAPTSTSTASVTVKLRAQGVLGAALSQPLVISLVSAPTALELSADRTYVGQGEPVQLTWRAGPNAPDLKSIVITDGTTNLLSLDEAAITALSPIGDKLTVRPTTDTTYTLRVTNDAGDTATTSVSVKARAPEVTFQADKADGPSGDLFTLSWTTQGAASLVVRDPSGAILTGAGPTFPLVYPANQTQMASGSALTRVTSSGAYTLEATNPSGTTTASVSLSIVSDLRIISFTATKEEQTSGEKVRLKWETFNSDSLTIEALGNATPIVSDSVDYDLRRRGEVDGVVQATDTTYRLTVTRGAETLTQDLVVRAASAAKITSFTATPSTVGWDQDVTLSWTTQDAVSIRLYSTQTTAANSPNGSEITAARGQLNGSTTVRLQKSTGFRLVAVNRIGTQVSQTLATPVTVNTGAPTVTLTVNPTAAPRGGLVDLSWTGQNVDRVFLWARNPVTAAHSADNVQPPYDFRPYGFIDISATGTELPMQDFDGNANFDTGFAMVELPERFRPMIFSDTDDRMARMKVFADGYIMLAPEGTLDTSPMFFNCSTPTSPTCTVTSPTSLTSSTSTTTPRNMLAPFWAALSARQGCTNAASTACQTGRAPGRILWQVIGTEPERIAIVQWDKWDSSVAAGAGEYTFQAKIYENGDVEYQYKTLQSLEPTYAKGMDATVGIDKRFNGTPAHNYFVQIPSSSTTDAVRMFLNPGDGWRIYSGAQKSSGSIRSYFNTTFTTGTPAKVQFKAMGRNQNASSNTVFDSKPLEVKGGVDQIVISELMVDPSSASDDNQQWIELRNLQTVAAPLDGYKIQTSSFSYTFGPTASIPASGHLIVAQANATLPTSGVTVVTVPNTGLIMEQPADEVILTYGSVLIDRAPYDFNAGWSTTSGKSMSFDPNYTLPSSQNDGPSSWCGQRPAAGSQPSTPGVLNPTCYWFDSITQDPSYKLAGDPAAVEVIDTSGTAHNRIVTVPIGFAFPYFGKKVTSLTISEDGHVALTRYQGTTSGVSNNPLPYIPTTATTAGATDGIYPFWDDLQRGIAGRGHILTKAYGNPGSQIFVVHWDGYTFGSSGGEASFQLVLKETGEIEFHYDTMKQAGSTGLHLGSSATVGFEAYGDTYGVMLGHGTSTTGGYLPPAPFAYKLRRTQ
jgi:hypothetical protein